MPDLRHQPRQHHDIAKTRKPERPPDAPRVDRCTRREHRSGSRRTREILRTSDQRTRPSDAAPTYRRRPSACRLGVFCEHQAEQLRPRINQMNTTSQPSDDATRSCAPVTGSAWSRDRVALANADYEERRQRDPSYEWSIRTIEREWKLKAGQLTNYRSNRRHRKDSGVSLLFPKSKWPTTFAATITGSNERTGSEMPAEGNRDGSVWSSGHPRESLSPNNEPRRLAE